MWRWWLEEGTGWLPTSGIVHVIINNQAVCDARTWRCAKEESTLPQCWRYSEENEQKHTQSLQSTPHTEEGPMVRTLILGPGSSRALVAKCTVRI